MVNTDVQGASREHSLVEIEIDAFFVCELSVMAL